MAGPSFILSIPIGAWNAALPMAVASLLAQDVDLRLALLDASGDSRVAEALAPLQPLVRYRRSGPDAGQAAAIQEGWDAVEGDVYGWLNADDFLFPDALARAAVAFQTNPDCAAVTAQSVFVTPQFHHLGAHPGVHPPSEALLRGNIISQPSTWVRRAALEQIGGLNIRLHYTMDWDLWVRLSQAGHRFEYIDEALSGVVISDATKTAQFNPRRATEIARIVAHYQGVLAAAKSLIGFWRHHSASRSGAASPAQPCADGFFYASQEITGQVRLPFVRYGLDVEGLWIHGAGEVVASVDGRPLGTLTPNEKAAFRWPRGKAGEVILTPAAGTARIDRVEFL